MNNDNKLNEQLEKIKKIVSDYDEFCRVAEDLEWFPVHEEHYKWCSDYVCCVYIDSFEFPQNYLKNDLAAAYVRAVISDMSFYEEWDKDNWNMTRSQRRENLTHPQSLYRTYSKILCPRFKPISSGWLKSEIDLFGKDGINTPEYQKFIKYIENAFITELGGNYEEDHTCLAVNGDTLLVIDYGAYD